MGNLNYIDGHARKILISNVTSQLAQGSTQDFGSIEVRRYSRFTGYLQATSVGVNGMTLRWRFSTQSGGPWQATSSTAVTSGATAFSGTVLDFLNYGQHADFLILSPDSTTIYTVLLQGEPMR